ncbi:hypothetical protein C8Q76DRAFT_796852 [Earliella scabrosa]|nr:hypothetical protein C8Q76DRAFT_796852 [Earliella scabrosa]
MAPRPLIRIASAVALSSSRRPPIVPSIPALLTIMPVSSVPVPDREFFLSFVDFEVGEVLFRLPKYLFEHSAYFQYVFSGPSDWSGSTPRYTLNDVSDTQFRDFVRLLLDVPHRTSSASACAPPKHKFTPATWLSIITLATSWGFDTLRARALAEISLLRDPVLQLAVGTQCGEKRFLPGALDELVDRAETPTVSDHALLGTELLMRLMDYRERCRRHGAKVPLRDICGHVEKIRRGNLERVFGAAFVRDVEEGERLIKVASGQS